MIHAMVRMVIPFKNRSEILEILSGIMERTQFEPGCISSRLYHGVEDQRVILLQEYWECYEDLERHVRSEEYRQLLLIFEMSREKPEFRFDEIAKSTGIETVAKARKPGAIDEYVLV